MIKRKTHQYQNFLLVGITGMIFLLNIYTWNSKKYNHSHTESRLSLNSNLCLLEATEEINASQNPRADVFVFCAGFLE